MDVNANKLQCLVVMGCICLDCACPCFLLGEHMTEEELAEYFSTLLGLNPEGGRSELGNYDSAGTVNKPIAAVT